MFSVHSLQLVLSFRNSLPDPILPFLATADSHNRTHTDKKAQLGLLSAKSKQNDETQSLSMTGVMPVVAERSKILGDKQPSVLFTIIVVTVLSYQQTRRSCMLKSFFRAWLHVKINQRAWD